MQGIITYERASGCAVTITGGTACVDDHITSTYRYDRTRSDGSRVYVAASANEYAREGSHWDITYFTCGC